MLLKAIALAICVLAIVFIPLWFGVYLKQTPTRAVLRWVNELANIAVFIFGAVYLQVDFILALCVLAVMGFGMVLIFKHFCKPTQAMLEDDGVS